MSAPDEFEQIARLYRPLTRGTAGAFDLLDDAAVVPARPGMDLVITQDSVVEGVHFLSGTPPALVARKLLRVNLSDLAAKGAEPYGYFLAACWPADHGWPLRQAFAEGLKADGEAFGLALLGGDTTGTPGPLTLSATMLGWVPAGGMVRRAGAQPGDLIQVSGAIGDAGLGLAALKGELADPDGSLTARHQLPQPRLDLREALRAGAHAACDVSDGLVADAGHIGEASGVSVRLDLDRMPVSPAATRWLASQADRRAALVRLATSGDDYEIVCAAPHALDGFTVVGMAVEGSGIDCRVDGVRADAGAGGWRHG